MKRLTQEDDLVLLREYEGRIEHYTFGDFLIILTFAILEVIVFFMNKGIGIMLFIFLLIYCLYRGNKKYESDKLISNELRRRGLI